MGLAPHERRVLARIEQTIRRSGRLTPVDARWVVDAAIAW
jgi:hypothetical protein